MSADHKTGVRLALAAAVVLAVPAVGAQEGGTASAPPASEDAGAVETAVAETGAGSDAGDGSQSEAPAVAAGSGGGDGSEPETPAVAVEPVAAADAAPARAAGRAVVREAAVGIRSFEPEATMAAAIRAVGALGGYVQESETGSAELRVPADRLDAALAALREIGEVVREDVTSEDVTMELATLRGRIEQLETSRRRVQGLLAVAETVADSLDVERTLREVTGELESQQGRLRFLLARTELSSVSLVVSMRERPTERLPRVRQPFPWVESYGLDAVLP
ncbi:MAG: DUF4349 domain-containing protein [Deltaproteobacteria bacterium]|nr:DUF4349 domain-containing protein [Deltaproteobacteria bacterium]